LAGIYEILKDTDRRAVYDRVLVEGLPDWRSPVFYYRRMRKIGLAEGLAYLFVIATIFQYFISWAAYWERKFTLKEVITYQMGKKSIKKTKKSMGKSDDEIKDMIEEQELKVLGPRPSFWDTLPFQTFNLTKYLIVSIPMLPFTLRDMYKVSYFWGINSDIETTFVIC
jgi:DnaJ family protein C protein 1